MKPQEFCSTYCACSEGARFALQFQTMEEVWNYCERPDWMFWILDKHKPLEKEQSVRLAIAFAESVIQYVPKNEDRPARAIQAAKNWIENPTEENRLAADAAAAAAARWATTTAAAAAAAAADAAAAAAARWATTTAAAAARWAAAAADAAAARWAAAADAAARKQQCEIIREFIPNPFKE
jgi:hypothetical protein